MLKKTIHKTLSRPLMILTIIPLIAFFIIPSGLTYKYFKDEIVKEGELLIATSEAQMNTFIDQTNREFNYIKTTLFSSSNTDFNSKSLEFSSLFKNIYRVELLDSTGKITATIPYDDTIIGFDRSLSSAYLSAKDANNFENGTVFFDTAIKSPSISWGTRLDDGNVLVCYLTLEYMNTFLSDITISDHMIMALIDQNGTYIANSIPEYVYSRTVDIHYTDFITEKIALDGSETVQINAQNYIPFGKIYPYNNWVFIVYHNEEVLLKSFYPYMLFYLFFSIIIFGVTQYILKKKVYSICNSIASLSQLTKAIFEEEYDIDTYESGYEELDAIYFHFITLLNDSLNRIKEIGAMNDVLEARVSERTIDLERSIETLKKTQEKVIQEEKISSMVILTTGLAQELTTPFDIAATLISHIKAGLKDLNHSSTEDQLHNLFSSIDILERNITFTIRLLNSFKRISGDQQHDVVDIFDLERLVDDVRMIHQPLLKRHDVIFTCNTKNSFRIKGNPNLFEKLLSALIVNSIEHGFDNRHHNQISISLQKNKEALTIIYSDNGKGIQENHRPHIFEPFFTTTKDRGNTGLGLSTLYNIVTKQLSGDIELSSTKNNGSTFIIKIPLIGEDNKANLYSVKPIQK